VINKTSLKEEGYRTLKNEALILRSMDHPNIVKFYEVKIHSYVLLLNLNDF